MRKGTLLELLDKVLKTGTKQAQADTIREFQSDDLVRLNYHLIDRKSANGEKF